jgi:peptidoglycan/xylan/chitin deacetylase (PgdA/CDA1 family)
MFGQRGGTRVVSAHGVMFHHFHDQQHCQGQGAISAQDFRDLVDHVGRRHILPASEWMRRARDGELGDDDVCLTFDDALRCQFDVAFPLMRDLNLTAFWFVYSSVFEGHIELLEVYRYFRTTCFASIEEFYDEFTGDVISAHGEEYVNAMADFDPDTYLAAHPIYSREDRIFRYLRDDVLGVARYQATMQTLMARKAFDVGAAKNLLWMDDSHLRQLRDAGHLIGLHSYSHPTRLVEMAADAQAGEFRRNADHLERVLGERPACMSHPCNSYDETTLAVLQRLGVAIGFRANMEPTANQSRLEFPREDHANIMKEMRG